jgi:protein TonB
MSNLSENEQRINNLIFANRNQKYGAYQIRSGYTTTLAKSVLLTICGFTSLSLIAFYFSREEVADFIKKAPPDDQVNVTPFESKPVTEQKKTEKSLPAAAKHKTASGNFILTDSVHKSASFSVAAMAAGNTTLTEGPASASTDTNDGDFSNKPEIKKETIHNDFSVDSQPEFEGGLKALQKFLQSQLRYPVVAREEGQEGTVYARFVVEESGNIGDIQLMNNPGYGMDEEALRVIKMIPAFKKPALLGGVPVKVYFQLPISFKLR